MDITKIGLEEEAEIDEAIEEEVVESDEPEVEVEDDGSTEVDETTDEDDKPQYSKKQIEHAIKSRVSTLNRKLEKYKPYEDAVRKIGEITGLSVGDLIARLEAMTDAEQAKVLGLTPEQVAQRRIQSQLQRAADQRTMQLQRELEEQKLISNPKYKDYFLYKDEIYEIMDENPKLTMVQAYTLAKGDKGIQAEKRDAEQRAIARLTKSSNQRVVKPGVNTPKTEPKIDSATILAAKRVGMDPREYAIYSNISSLEEYEKLKSSKKGK